VTSDNPRSEDPLKIVDDILSGMERKKRGLHIEIDRREAIRAAVRAARPGDIVAICGKGHEDYQIVGTTPVPISTTASKHRKRWTNGRAD